ncbi:MAG: BrnA antitoxin family protein [Betaproteobacteria bacterium]|nr:BrnA antitoxin family protein [Betaproteobacteria bacterium]
MSAKRGQDQYREQGAGWQTRMNAVLKAFRDAAS